VGVSIRCRQPADRRLVGPDVQVVLVLDRAGWHLSKALRAPENISLLHLPAYSPELNPVERLWAYCDYDDLFQACGEAWNQLTPEQLCLIFRAEWMPHTN